ERHQSDVTSAVARSSAGAVNHLPIVQQSDLRATIEILKNAGIRIVATAMRTGVPLTDWNFNQPTAIIMGNESTGIADELLQLCDATVHIPQAGQIESLNAAVAAGIVCYELQRQRNAHTTLIELLHESQHVDTASPESP
ncbi:MAG: RNA methyltransferase, partial [Planctomycetaceae bacterium]|nr:RNA methyltransferase [Planctomycetaceae bacterium]